MKKILQKILLLTLFLLSLVTSATAIVDIVEQKVQLAVDYNDFTDDRQRTIPETISFILRNPDATESIATVTVTGLPADKGYTTETKSVTLAPATSQTVTLQIQVPHLKGNGNETVGTVTATVGGVQVDTAPLEQVTASMLELSRLEVEYTDEEGNTQRDTFSDDDQEFTLEENVRVGSTISLKIKLENLFDKDYDSDQSTIENIQLTLDADEELVGSDFEEDYDFEDLDAEDTQELTIEWEIDEDADADTYTIDFTLEGEDGEQATYRLERELQLELKRARDDLRIISARFLPATVAACDPASTRLEVELKNFGTRDQDFAALQVSNSALDIEENIAPIKISRHGRTDDTFRKTFTFDLSEAKTGTHPFRIIAYHQRDEIGDEQAVDLTVTRCNTGSSSSTTSSTTTGSTAGTASNTAATTVSTTAGTAAAPSTTTTSTATGTASNTAATAVSTTAGTAAAPSLPFPTTSTIGAPVALIQTTERSYSANDILLGSMIVMIILLIAMICLFVVILLRK